MGLSQSKNTQPAVVQQKALDLTPQFTAPEGIVEKIKGLGDVIGFFNDNDTSSIENFVDTYNKQVSAKDQIEIGPEIKGLMLGFHNQLLEVIDGQLIGATSSEKQQVLKSKLKDNKALNEMLRLYYNQKMQDVESRVLNDEVVRSNPEITETVRIIMNNVKSLKVKYKFFEYKYIQLNVFMIVFIQYVYNSMGKFIVDVIAYNQARDAIRQEMTQKIFRATQEIMGSSDMQLKPQDAEAINRMITNLQDKVSRDQKEIQEMSGKLKNNSLSDLLNFVLTSDETLASHIMEGVDKYKATKATDVQQQKNQPTTPLAQMYQPKPQYPAQPQPQPQPTQAYQPKPQFQPKPAQQVVQNQTLNQQQQPYQPKPAQQVVQNQTITSTEQPQPYQPKPYLGKKPFNSSYQQQQPANSKKANASQANSKQVNASQAQQPANAKKMNVSQTITQAPQPPVILTGGFWRDNSLIPQQQTGGFIRDSSLIPQPFFELTKGL
jgi:hypothetical protein